MKRYNIDIYRTFYFLFGSIMIAGSILNAQTYTVEEIPRPFSQVSYLQVFAENFNPAYIVAIADTQSYLPYPFDLWLGQAYLYTSKWNGSSFGSSPILIDTAHLTNFGLYGIFEEFVASPVQDSSARIFIAWVKQQIEWSDVPPRYYKEPSLQIAVEENGFIQRTVQIPRGNRPHIIFDRTNQGHIVWEQTTPLQEIPESPPDSNFLVYSSSIVYAEVQSNGFLGTTRYIGKGFRPRMLVDLNNDLHFFWLDSDSSSSPIFKIMHRQLLAGELTSTVMLKDSVPLYSYNGWNQSVLPTVDYFADSAGNAYAGWTEFQDLAGTVFFVQQKNDNSVLVYSHQVDTLHQKNAGFYVQSNGTIHCVWTEINDGIKQSYYASGTDSQPLFASIRSFPSASENFHLVESSDRKVHCAYENTGIISFMRNVTDTNKVIFPTLSSKRISYRSYDEYNHPVAIDKEDQVWIAYESNTSSNMEGLVRIHRQTTDVRSIPISAPTNYYLYQNFPNPFNPVTFINFHVSNPGFVTLKVFDILGREVVTLINEQRGPGDYSIPFYAHSLSSGVYFYRLHITRTDIHHPFEFTSTRRMLLLK